MEEQGTTPQSIVFGRLWTKTTGKITEAPD